MVTLSKQALPLLLLGISVPVTSAFTLSSSRVAVSRTSGTQRMVATTPADFGISSPPGMNQQDDNDNNGAMMDLNGIAFSVSLNFCM